MPNLRRPVNNARSRNYLNSCNCVVAYDTICVRLRASNVIVSLDTCSAITLYRLQLTQLTSIRTIDFDYKTLFLVHVISVPINRYGAFFVDNLLLNLKHVLLNVSK